MATQFTIWENQTFTASAGTDYLAVSNVIGNPSNDDKLKIDIIYHSFTPQPANGSLVTAVLEEELATGVWIPFANQFQGINSNNNAPTRILEVRQSFNSNPGVDVFVDAGSGIRLSKTDGVVPENFRLCIVKKDFVGASNTLQDLTISAYGVLS